MDGSTTSETAVINGLSSDGRCFFRPTETLVRSTATSDFLDNLGARGDDTSTTDHNRSHDNFNQSSMNDRSIYQRCHLNQNSLYHNVLQHDSQISGDLRQIPDDLRHDHRHDLERHLLINGDHDHNRSMILTAVMLSQQQLSESINFDSSPHPHAADDDKMKGHNDSSSRSQDDAFSQNQSIIRSLEYDLPYIRESRKRAAPSSLLEDCQSKQQRIRHLNDSSSTGIITLGTAASNLSGSHLSHLTGFDNSDHSTNRGGLLPGLSQSQQFGTIDSLSHHTSATMETTASRGRCHTAVKRCRKTKHLDDQDIASPSDFETKSDIVAYVEQKLERMEESFTFKSATYQSHLKRFLPRPDEKHRKYIERIETFPRIPTSLTEQRELINLRKVQRGMTPDSRLGDSDGLTIKERLDEMLTSLVNKVSGNRIRVLHCYIDIIGNVYSD